MTDQPTGFLLIDKPAGMTSHDVVDRLRKITGIRKIGHAGTLDPFATGLLIVAVSRGATREISKFVGMSKVYESEFILGATTETLDPEGDVTTNNDGQRSSGDIKKAMESLTGDIKQIPPMHSAIKVGGKKLYELARQGKEIEREPRDITIHSFELIGEPTFDDPVTSIHIRTDVSSGTYIRSLARDLAEKLGTIGYVKSLRRTSIGEFFVKDAVKLDDLSSENWTNFLSPLV